MPKLSRNGSSSRRSDVAEDLSETSTNNEEDNVFEELFGAVSVKFVFMFLYYQKHWWVKPENQNECRIKRFMYYYLHFTFLGL